MRPTKKNKNFTLLSVRGIILIALGLCAAAAKASTISASGVTPNWSCGGGECSVTGQVTLSGSCWSITHSCSLSATNGATLSDTTFTDASGKTIPYETVATVKTGTTRFTLTWTDIQYEQGSYRYVTKTASATVSLTNQAPTISNIANISINEDGAKTVSFSISDRETPAGQLTLSKSSSNTTLLPSGNITFGGSGGSRTVTLKPTKNKSGSATVTIGISDGEKTARDSFILTVNAVNDAPTISNIANQTINEDGSKTISFSVSDVETASGSLALSATSSNTALLPINRITFGGSGSSRSVTLKPAANKSGSVAVTLRVFDGSKSTSDSFQLVVNPVNDLPKIDALNDRTTNMNTTVEYNVSISDVETALGSLQISAISGNTTLLPNNRIQLFSRSDGKRIVLTPMSDRPGSATVTLSVSDGTASVSKSFTLTVKEPGGLVSYRYDELGRLIKVTGTDGKITEYGYDKSDNRTEKRVNY